MAINSRSPGGVSGVRVATEPQEAQAQDVNKLSVNIRFDDVRVTTSNRTLDLKTVLNGYR